MYLCSLKLVLEAVNASMLPISHGRLLHAAFLNLIRDIDPILSAAIHDAQVKSFAVGTLRTKAFKNNNSFSFKSGDIAIWRVGLIGVELMQVMAKISRDTALHIGRSNFIIRDIICDRQNDVATGLTTMAELQQEVFSLPEMQSIQMDFLSPTTFRVNDYDMPVPKPELIFGSLAEKWNAFSEEENFDLKNIKELASRLLPLYWQGGTKRVNITQTRGVTAFVGSYTYSFSLLPGEYRKLFILLAEFGRFVGVGRLTAQGLGHIDIKYN